MISHPFSSIGPCRLFPCSHCTPISSMLNKCSVYLLVQIVNSMTPVHRVQWLLLGLNWSFNRAAHSPRSLEDWLHFFSLYPKQKNKEHPVPLAAMFQVSTGLLLFLGFPPGFPVIITCTSNIFFIYYYFFFFSGKGKQTAFPLPKSFVPLVA